MEIKIKNKKGEFESLEFSKYLYCTSSSVKVLNNLAELNGKAGSFLADVDSHIGSRNFVIQGNFEADNLQAVEAFRGKVFHALFAKSLFLFLDNDEEKENGSYYRVVLDGNVNTTYNQGWNIGRIFTLSFTLVSLLPYSYKKSCEERFYAENITNELIIYYNGIIPTFPIIIFEFYADVEIKATEFPLLKNQDREIRLNKDIAFSKNEMLIIKNGMPLIGDAFSFEYNYELFKKEAILNPFIIFTGENNIKLDMGAIKTEPSNYSITISFDEINY